MYAQYIFVTDYTGYVFKSNTSLIYITSENILKAKKKKT